LLPSPDFGTSWATYDTDATLRYVGPDGQVSHVKGTSGGQQGDPLEMMRFSATIHPVWARVMARHPRARALAFADDGFVRLSVVECLHILAEFKSAFKDDALVGWIARRPHSQQWLRQGQLLDDHEAWTARPQADLKDTRELDPAQVRRSDPRCQ